METDQLTWKVIPQQTMRLFPKKKTRAEKSRLDALIATKSVMQRGVDQVAKNGYFSYFRSIRREFKDGRDLSADIVPILKEEFEKDGYTVTIENDNFIINW